MTFLIAVDELSQSNLTISNHTDVVNRWADGLDPPLVTTIQNQRFCGWIRVAIEFFHVLGLTCTISKENFLISLSEGRRKLENSKMEVKI